MRSCAYRVTEPAATGQSFELLSEELAPENVRRDAQVQVDLVNAATVWYTVECPLEQEGEKARA